MIYGVIYYTCPFRTGEFCTWQSTSVVVGTFISPAAKLKRVYRSICSIYAVIKRVIYFMHVTKATLIIYNETYNTPGRVEIF